MARRVSWTNNSSGHLGTYVYRAPTLDPQSLPAPVATVGPVAQGETAEWVDTDDLSAGDYEYAVRDYDGSEEGELSAVVSHNIPDPFANAQVGDEIGGGIYVGTHSVEGADYYLVSCKDEHCMQRDEKGDDTRIKTSDTSTVGTSSSVDGFANTQAMVADSLADHPVANYIFNRDVEGYQDWYIPSPGESALFDDLFSSGHPSFTLPVDRSNGLWTSQQASVSKQYFRRADGSASSTAKTYAVPYVRFVRRVPV